MPSRLSTPQRELLKRLQRGVAVPVEQTHTAVVDALIRRGLARLETRTVTEVKTCVVYKAQS